MLVLHVLRVVRVVRVVRVLHVLYVVRVLPAVPAPGPRMFEDAAVSEQCGGEPAWAVHLTEPW